MRSGSTDRFTVSPSKIFLKSGHSCQLQVKLKVLKFVQKKKAAEQGQRDVFHIKVRRVCLYILIGTSNALNVQEKDRRSFFSVKASHLAI